MINKKQLFSIQWTDSFIQNLNVQKNEKSLDIKLLIDSTNLLEIFFHDCYAVFFTNYGYFIGKETIRDIELNIDSERVFFEKNKLLDSSMTLNEINIFLNSGGILSFLITDSTTFSCIEK